MITTEIDKEVLSTMLRIPENGGTCHPHGRVIKVFYGWFMLGEIEYGGEDVDGDDYFLVSAEQRKKIISILTKVPA